MTEILDLVVALLLVVAIAYGFVLNKRIVLIQDSKKELANLFKSFDDTIFRAQSGIDALKSASVGASTELQKKIDRAIILMDDISFLNDRAIEISKMLEASGKKFAPGETYKPEQNTQQRPIRSASPAQKNLPANTDRKPANSEQQKRAKVLEGLLEKIAEGNAKKEIDGNRSTAISKPNITGKEKDAKEQQVASMLKALGYGE